MSEQEFLKQAEQIGIDIVQLTKVTTKEDSVKYVNETREKYDISNTISYLIKAEKDKKTVKIRSNFLDQSILDKILMKLKYVEVQNKDDYLEKILENKDNKKVDTIDITKVFPKIETAISKKIAVSIITKIEIVYAEIYKQIEIINNKGVYLSTNKHNYMLYIELAANKNGKDVVTQKTINQTTGDFNFIELIEKEIEEAENRVNEIILKTGKYNILFENKVAGKLIENIMYGLNADEIQKGSSMFIGNLNQLIATPILNIIEDPTDKRYPGYANFDMEGTSCKRKEVIKNGTLKTYFYNNKTAAKDKVASTGNEYNGIGTSNLYVVPGKKTHDKLIEELKTGIVITSFMCGSNSISLEKGNISIQIFGYFIEDGIIKGGIKPAILTTTFVEFLNNIKEIGNDLMFSNPCTGSPSLLLEKLSIASDE